MIIAGAIGPTLGATGLVVVTGTTTGPATGGVTNTGVDTNTGETATGATIAVEAGDN